MQIMGGCYNCDRIRGSVTPTLRPRRRTHRIKTLEELKRVRMSNWS